MKDYKLAYVIMRAQLPTNAHFGLIEKAHAVADHVLVLLGSSNKAVQFSNPFSFKDRRTMLKSGLKPTEQMRTNFMALRDFDHLEHEWEKEVTRLVEKAASFGDTLVKDEEIAMVVHEKDDSTYYASAFPQYNKVEVPSFGDYNASDLRRTFFDVCPYMPLETRLERIADKTRPSVLKFLKEYAGRPDAFGYEYVKEQHAEIIRAKNPYINLQYGIKFKTADALVICGNKVLLGLRGVDCYGASLWALPGGYIEQGETSLDACYRELFEETEINVPERVLRNCHKGRLEFEGAKRDERGDFTTQCHIIVIEPDADGNPPAVKGATDLSKAKWFTFNEVEKMSKYMFLDHAGIIETCRRFAVIRKHFVTAM